MKKTIVEVYALLVCFFAVIVITVSLSVLIYSTVGVVNPELTMSSYEYEKYLNNDNFKSKGGITKEKAESLSDEEITVKRETAFAPEIRKERRKQSQSMLFSAIYFFVSSIILLIHWKISKKSRETTT
jgi:hypothetical protein